MAESDRDRVVLAEVISKAWRDPAYKARLLQDPGAVVKEAGGDVPAGVTLHALENTSRVIYLSVPQDVPQVKERLHGEIDRLLPLPQGAELRLVQNTDKDRYIVVPLPPAQGVALSDEDLAAIAAGGENVNTNDNANANANADVNVNGTVDVNVATAVNVAT